MPSGLRKHLVAISSGLRHFFHHRMTVKYPDVTTEIPQSNFAYDPKKGAALPGWKGRHLLYLDKCTGCQLCAIACENIAEAIVMMEVPEEKRGQNMKSLYPAVDYGRCVFCGFCVDACPFYALEMTPEMDLAELDRSNLFYTPQELAVPPKKVPRPLVKPVFEKLGAIHK